MFFIFFFSSCHIHLGVYSVFSWLSHSPSCQPNKLGCRFKGTSKYCKRDGCRCTISFASWSLPCYIWLQIALSQILEYKCWCFLRCKSVTESWNCIVRLTDVPYYCNKLTISQGQCSAVEDFSIFSVKWWFFLSGCKKKTSNGVQDKL